MIAGEKVDVKPGNAMPLRSMPIGTIIHNVEMKPLKGGQLARSAGAYAQLVGRDAGYAQIRLGSGELRMVLDSCMATVGAVSNPDHMNENLGKAGRVRHKGRRPARPRRGHEPDRPPARRRRRPHLGRPSPGHPLGQADQGPQDPHQQGDGQVHHPLAPREEGPLSHDPFGLERPVRRRLSAQEGGCRRKVRAART